MSDRNREAFEAWAIQKQYAYRDKNGIWFYPEWGNGNALWVAWSDASKGREELLEALKECQSALAVLTEPKEIRSTSVYQAWGIAVAAEAKARAVIQKNSEGAKE